MHDINTLDPSVERFIRRVEAERHEYAQCTTTIDIFGAPRMAKASPAGNLRLDYGGSISAVVFLMEDLRLATDLAAAVNGVLARHHAAAQAVPAIAAE